MAITFEEITGEVAPEPRGDDSRPAAEPEGADHPPLEARIRAVLDRERYRARRLSDR